MRRLYIDFSRADLGFVEGPRRGDYVQSRGRKGLGTKYYVFRSRMTEREPGLFRYHLLVEQVQVLDDRGFDISRHRRNREFRCFYFTWCSRKKRRHTFESLMRLRPNTNN